MAAGDEADLRARPHLEAGTFQVEVVATDPRLPLMVEALSALAPAGTKYIRFMPKNQAFTVAKRALSAGTSFASLGLPETKTQEDLNILLNYIALRILWARDAAEAAKAAEAKASIEAAVQLALAAAEVHRAPAPTLQTAPDARPTVTHAAADADEARRQAGPTPPAKRVHHGGSSSGGLVPFAPAARLHDDLAHLIVALRGAPPPDGASGEYQATDHDPVHIVVASIAPGVLAGTAAVSYGVFIDAVVSLMKGMAVRPTPMEMAVEARRLLQNKKASIKQYAQVEIDPSAATVGIVIAAMAELVNDFNEAPQATLHWMMVARLAATLELCDRPADVLNFDALMRARAVACGGDPQALQALYDPKGAAYRSALESEITAPRELRRTRGEFLARKGPAPLQWVPAAPAPTANPHSRGAHGAAARLVLPPRERHHDSRHRWEPDRDDGYGERSAPPPYREGAPPRDSDKAFDRRNDSNSGRPGDSSRDRPPKVCRDFNGDRGCQRGEVCKFPHVCSVCSPPNNNHPRGKCPMKR
jgi:hypothetical protein